MKNKNNYYKENKELNPEELILSEGNFRISQVNNNSLRLVAEILSFLHKADKELSERSEKSE